MAMSDLFAGGHLRFENGAWRDDNGDIVDVAQVVHGRWEKHPDMYGFVRCSSCRDCVVWDEWVNNEKWKYCPNCGAKMDKGEDDGKAKMYGAKSSYIPNAKADMRYRQKLFQHGRDVAERNTDNPKYNRRLEKEIKRCKRKQAMEEVQHVHP